MGALKLKIIDNKGQVVFYDVTKDDIWTLTPTWLRLSCWEFVRLTERTGVPFATLKKGWRVEVEAEDNGLQSLRAA